MHEVAALPPLASWVWLVDAALAEDLGAGDATSLALLEPARQGRARVEAREDLVLCGSALAAEVFSRFDVHYEPCADDGDGLVAEQLAAEVSGFARGMLSGERTALNFLQHLSGIATTTRAFCRAVAGTRAAIVDTRKTTPGWRTLEKYAVRCGGGVNHRTGLYDGILIKDNHIAAVGSVGDAVKRARECGPTGLKVQIEVESLDQARDALEAGAEALLIDNQPPQVLREIVALIDGRVPLEATGGVNIHNVAEIARTGVDRISIGALTHSAPAADIALEWIAASAT